MIFPAVISADWISRTRFSAIDFDQAESLSACEKFLESNLIIASTLEFETESQFDSVSAHKVLALYGWNIHNQMKYGEVEEFLSTVADEGLKKFPELMMIRLRLLIETGKFDDALRMCEDFEESNNTPISPYLCECLYVKGVALYKLGRLDDSVWNLEISHSLYRLQSDFNGAAFAANFLGFVNSRLSEYRTASKWLSIALPYYQSKTLPRKMSNVHLNLGITFYKTGEYDLAFYNLWKSHSFATSGEWPHRVCYANSALGNVFRLTRDFVSAKKHLHMAYEQAQSIHSPREEALALEFLGDVYRDDCSTQEARKYYARAFEIGKSLAFDGNIVMEVLRRVGECDFHEGDNGASLISLNKALILAKKQGDRYETALTLRSLSESTVSAGDLKSARRYINESVQILEDIEARHEHAISLMASATLALQEVEDPRTSTPRIVRLNEAWKQSTMALDLFIKVDVRWWTERGRALVSRVSAIRNAQEKSDKEMMTGGAAGKAGAYKPGNVIIYKSNVMRDMLQLCDMFASTGEPVLVTGETGTGKEVVAKRLHQHSDRAHKPMVIVNVAAIPATMFEREFFGHVKGAFSGAVSSSDGFAGRADGGTLFLDEIGDLPLELQPKLLRLIQEGTYQALGDPKQRTTDLRLVAATNANLEEKVKDGTFRADLFYRLCTLDLPLPAIKDRSDDILPLMRHFLCEAIGQPVDLATYFSRASLDAMEEYAWPGNVREIAMVARQAHVSLAALGRVEVNIRRFDGEDLKLTSQDLKKMQAAATGEANTSHDSTLSQSDTVERSRILMALEEAGDNRNIAAKALGISRSTLYRKMEKYGIPTRRI